MVQENGPRGQRGRDYSTSGNGAAGGNPTLEAARAYLGAGISFLPLRLDGSKAPSGPDLPTKLDKGRSKPTWDPYKERLPTTEETTQWFDRPDPRGIATVTGKVSGNLELLDFDADALETFAAWKKLVEAESPGLLEKLSVTRTPRQPAGYHVRYRCQEAVIPGNTKLAEKAGPPNPKTGKPTKLTLIETRGEGGYGVAPGSPGACHETGGTYDHLSGPKLSKVQNITAAEREVLWRCAQALNQLPQEERGPKPKGGNKGERPGDNYDLSGPDWETIIGPHGWTKVSDNGNTVYWRRPGKDGPGISATTGYCRGKDGADLLYVFSSNAAPLEAGRAYGKFAAYALLNHQGDFKAAAKQLAGDGYGDKSGSREQDVEALAAKVQALIDKLPPDNASEAALRNRDLVDALLRLERHDAAEFVLARQRLRGLGVKVGDLDAVLKRTRRAWRSGPESPQSPGSLYQIRDGRFWQKKNTPMGEVLVPLCNFVAAVTKSVRVDDGSGEIEHEFTVEGQLADGTPLPAVAIKANEFATLNWVLPNWGMAANVAAGLGAKDNLRAAIQELSRDVAHHVVYKHTGWRKLGEDWVYLHGGGAVGAAGPVEGVAVQLDDRLRYYVLPPPPAGSILAEAIRASLKILRLGPDRIMMPCLGAVYRAVLGRIDSSVALVGATAMGKSETSALLQQHFGAGMARLNLPGNWSSTANALEGLAFLAKDALFTIDEFKPGGGKYEAEEMHRKAERVLRAQGNRSGRQRCRADGTIRPSREPRGLILISGEDTPRGESLQARILLVGVGHGDIAVQSLGPFQKDAADGLYAQALAAYLKWLAGRYEDLQKTLPQQHADLRTKAAADHSGLHPRVPGIVADLFLGWRYWLMFAAEAGAVTKEESSDLAERAWQGLLLAASDQAAEIAARNPCRRFLELVSSVISSRRAHLTDQNGSEPGDPLSWGYRERVYNAGAEEGPGIAYDPQGKCIGFVVGEDVYLDPETAYGEAMALGDTGADRLAVSKDQLFRRLKEQGVLASHEPDKTLTRRLYQGRKKYFLHLRTASLSSPEQGLQGLRGPDPSKPEKKVPVSGPCSQGGGRKQGPKTGAHSRGKPGRAPKAPKAPVSGRGEGPHGANGEVLYEEGVL
jgi:hypothetical protein